MSTWLNGTHTQFRTIDNLTIRFAESEDRDDHALLLSPWPESLYAFEPTWARLAEHTHLVAIDLPGFGHSQRRDALLSPQAMGEFLIRIADAFGLENPQVIGPDVGTCCPRPTRRYRSSPGRETRRYHRSTPNFSLSGCQTASSTSSTPDTSRGRTQRTSTPRWPRVGGKEAT